LYDLSPQEETESGKMTLTPEDVLARAATSSPDGRIANADIGGSACWNLVLFEGYVLRFSPDSSDWRKGYWAYYRDDSRLGQGRRGTRDQLIAEISFALKGGAKDLTGQPALSCRSDLTGPHDHEEASHAASGSAAARRLMH